MIVPPDDFDRLYHTLFPRLAAEMYAYLGDRAEAEDVAQEALLRTWQRWELVGGYDQPIAWVRRVAWNLATSRWRRIIAAARATSRHRASTTTTEALGLEHVALVVALRALPERRRRAIVLHYIADLPVAQIALDLGVPKGTVVSWLHRGRAELAALLADEPHQTKPTEETTRHA